MKINISADNKFLMDLIMKYHPEITHPHPFMVGTIDLDQLTESEKKSFINYKLTRDEESYEYR